MYIRCFLKKLLARCLTVHNTSLEKSFYRGGQISLYAPYVLLAHPIGQIGGQKQSVCPIGTQLEPFLFVLY